MYRVISWWISARRYSPHRFSESDLHLHQEIKKKFVLLQTWIDGGEKHYIARPLPTVGLTLHADQCRRAL